MSVDHEKAFLENILESVIAVDKEGKIREVNQATLKLLGYKRKEDLIMLPMQKICKVFSLEKLKDKIPLQEQELIYLGKDRKKIPVSVNIAGRVSYPDDIIFMARDISKTKGLISELIESRGEIKDSYTELQESKDALIRTEKLAYTGRIAANIAHEIRNPLTNVAMSIQQLKKIIKPDNHMAKHIDIVERNTVRINYLITELLNCARPPRLNLKPYNLHKILKSAIESTRTKIKSRGIKVIKKLTFNPPKVMVDREQIGRVFLNVVLNAVDAMLKGGKLTIITEVNKHFFIVKVQDNGKGIPEKDIMRIFEPFFSTKSDGVGLGLTLCYGIIASHGGTIEVESRLKKGSTFTVSLPLEQEFREKERE